MATDTAVRLASLQQQHALVSEELVRLITRQSTLLSEGDPLAESYATWIHDDSNTLLGLSREIRSLQATVEG